MNELTSRDFEFVCGGYVVPQSAGEVPITNAVNTAEWDYNYAKSYVSSFASSLYSTISH